MIQIRGLIDVDEKINSRKEIRGMVEKPFPGRFVE